MPEEAVPDDAVDISGDGGCCKRILQAGEGDDTPFDGAEVQVHYVGTLMDGTKFDSSRDRPGNFKFQLGRGAVIKGWDTGVATMRRGEKAELFCRSDYAYGESGSPPKIPGGATLKFEVELLDWGEKAKERWDYSAKEKIDLASEKKCEGTVAFKAGRWEEARTKYADAIDWVDRGYEFTEEGEKAEAGELLLSCLLNAAQCSIKLNDFTEVEKSCSKVLEQKSVTDAQKVKALFRRGVALTKLCEFAGARADLLYACKLDPKSKEIREAYASIKEAEASAKKADAGLFAKMVKGAGGYKKKPPPGVPADAVDISDDGGCCKRILQAGEGDDTPFDGAEVQVHYVGTLMDGTKFDSSRDRPVNFKFQLGRGAVIKGWDTGVATMRRGEKAELFCRSDYAYGESGSPPKIPGGATLKFEVELLDWGEKAKERWDYSGKEKIDLASEKKGEGTVAFKAGRWEEARTKYADGIDWVDRGYEF